MLALLRRLGAELTGQRRLLMLMTCGVPALAFALGAVAKLHDPFPAAHFVFNALGIRLSSAYALVRVLAVVELVLAAALCLGASRSALPACGAMGLLALFMGLLARVAASHPAAAWCGCFGSLVGERLARSLWTQFWIYAGLASLLVAYVALLQPIRRPIQFAR